MTDEQLDSRQNVLLAWIFPSRHTPFCTQLLSHADKKKKNPKKLFYSLDNPAAKADVSYLQQLLNSQKMKA